MCCDKGINKNIMHQCANNTTPNIACCDLQHGKFCYCYDFDLLGWSLFTSQWLHARIDWYKLLHLSVRVIISTNSYLIMHSINFGCLLGQQWYPKWNAMKYHISTEPKRFSGYCQNATQNIMDYRGCSGHCFPEFDFTSY